MQNCLKLFFIVTSFIMPI